MDKLSDNELAKLAAEGNEDAFKCLIERHYMTIYKIAYKFCGVREDAEDITQETLIKLVRALKSFRCDASFTTWLYRIVVNVANDHHRARDRRKETNLEGVGDIIYDNPGQEEESSAKQVYSIISKLPVKLRKVVLLVFGEGMSHGEAAKILGCAETTISWRIFQARKILKKYLEE